MKTKFTYLVGATYLIEVGSFRFLSDPGFDPDGTEKSEGPGHDLKKNMAPPLPVEEVGRIDAVFVSHAHHYDNLDNTGKAWLPKWGKILTHPERGEDSRGQRRRHRIRNLGIDEAHERAG